MRPSRMSRSSTPPRRPWKLVSTGVPSAAASRFMVPPAEITRSAKATSDWASIGVRRQRQLLAARAVRARCSACARSITTWTPRVRATPAQAIENLHEESLAKRW